MRLAIRVATWVDTGGVLENFLYGTPNEFQVLDVLCGSVDRSCGDRLGSFDGHISSLDDRNWGR
jgi:hypothetical protein